MSSAGSAASYVSKVYLNSELVLLSDEWAGRFARPHPLWMPSAEMLIRADAFSLVDIVLCVCVICMSLILMHMGFDTNISIINAYTIYCQYIMLPYQLLTGFLRSGAAERRP